MVNIGNKYFVKTPWWLKKLYPNRIWHIDTKEKAVFLTFDDGPHPNATPFVLDQLKQFNAKATFFCIGKNVLAHPEIYKQIIDEGHTVGNHTQHHLNGWKTNDEEYLKDVAEASIVINSSLFRPPYGRIRSSQAKRLKDFMNKNEVRLLMWDILSGDFDTGLSNEQCLLNATSRTRPGSIIVFHDSEKAFPRLAFALPRCLEFFSQEGYSFKNL